MDDEAPRLTYNPDDGSVELRLGGRTVTIDGIDAEVAFERMTPDGEAAAPLWLGQAEADVLRKMIRYILDRVRITEESKVTLAELLPRVETIADAERDADEGGPEPGPAAPGRGAGASGSGGRGDADRGRAASSQGDRGPTERDEGDRGRTGREINVPGVRRGLGRSDDGDDDG